MSVEKIRAALVAYKELSDALAEEVCPMGGEEAAEALRLFDEMVSAEPVGTVSRFHGDAWIGTGFNGRLKVGTKLYASPVAQPDNDFKGRAVMLLSEAHEAYIDGFDWTGDMIDEYESLTAVKEQV